MQKKNTVVKNNGIKKLKKFRVKNKRPQLGDIQKRIN